MPAIRQIVHIAATPRAVWKALTTVEGLKSWLVDEARLEPRDGGRVVWAYHGDDDDMIEGRGMIHKWRPTSHFEISWDRQGPFPSAGTHMVFKLARDGDETRLSLVQSGPVTDDDESRAEILKEWKRDLKALQSMLDAD
jgi:uncharacterized protein YndB with AHSA1/START domain